MVFPDWLATTTHGPSTLPAVMVAPFFLPDVHMDGVVEVNVTVNPELAVPVRVTDVLNFRLTGAFDTVIV